MSKEYDLAVVGAGPGGYVAAIRASQLGMKVVCIDKRKNLGGTCLNIGCIPSKTLLQITEHYDFAKNKSQDSGIHCEGVSFDFNQIMEKKKGVIKGLANGISMLFRKNKVTYSQGRAELMSSNQIMVTSDAGESSEIKAKHIILATGSEAIELPFLPFDEKKIVSSTGALSLEKVPKTMTVIGGGAIGLELASVYSRLGSKVTVVEMLPQICPNTDVALSKALLQSLKSQGLAFYLNTKVMKGSIKDEGVELVIEKEGKTESLLGEVVLVAVGRKPFSEGLCLEKLGITTDQRGFIPVDGKFQTSLPGVYAIGDLVEGAMLAHRASEEGVVLAELLANKKSCMNYLTVPNVIYTNPEVASVGLTEEEVKDFGITPCIGTFSFKGNARARACGEDEGFVKVVGDKKTDRLLGLHIIGPHASELVAAGAQWIEAGVTLEEIGEACFAHPTLSEAIKEAALQAHKKAIHC